MTGENIDQMIENVRKIVNGRFNVHEVESLDNCIKVGLSYEILV
jgi:hypothetical protein